MWEIWKTTKSAFVWHKQKRLECLCFIWDIHSIHECVEYNLLIFCVILSRLNFRMVLFLGFSWLRYISGFHLFVLGFPFRSTVPFARTNCPCITQRETFLRLSTLSLLIFVYFFSNSQISFSLSLFHTNSIRVERAQCSLCGILVISEIYIWSWLERVDFRGDWGLEPLQIVLIVSKNIHAKFDADMLNSIEPFSEHTYIFLLYI